ncbi:MAG: hypothetical protein IMF26_04705 [Candidatus Fermentithermobacillus carboniphilus]|uniref:Fructose-bisphosphate aldolase n=1 Tax=Candidatus Fermentithermobacillus carboniphilus TaxID=3085328 RepID=A0AAT9LE92_9FIRM|nr:MAG: hypothetical protein IMF26_04705 [Candidatus Fermentithermobacillus carboniphilus]
MLGKTIRMKRLIQQDTGSCIIFAIDHGMTSPTLLRGLMDTRTRVKQAISGGANVLMLGRGFAYKTVEEFKPDTSLALMMTACAAGRPAGPKITPISSVEEALRLGADAVTVYVALAQDYEPEMIRYLSDVGEKCDFWGMPLIAEAEYPTAYQSLDTLETEYGADYLKRNARLCAEMGADIIKVNWPGSIKDMAEIIEATQVPVVLAGGPRISDEELLDRMAQAREAGAIGCSVGRNIFEHENPEAITRAISMIFKDKVSGKVAYEYLQEQLNRR